MANCPMMMKDVEKTFVNTKDGVDDHPLSKNPETVKKIQEWAAQDQRAAAWAKWTKRDAPWARIAP